MTLSVAQEGCPTEPFRLLLGLGGLEPAVSGMLRGDSQLAERPRPFSLQNRLVGSKHSLLRVQQSGSGKENGSSHRVPDDKCCGPLEVRSRYNFLPGVQAMSDSLTGLNVIVMGMNDLENFESGSARRQRPAGDPRWVLETVPGLDRHRIPGVIIDKIQDINTIRQSVPNNVRIHDMPEVSVMDNIMTYSSSPEQYTTPHKRNEC